MALKLTVSQEWADGITDFLHVDTDSQKLTVSQKWTDGINWFLLAGTNPGEHKVDSIIFGWAWSKMVMAC